ncbi:MAG: hypothetical protein RLZZ574_34 [Cyanobacteriota bacterium]|jgi:hypothetical protein
MIILSSETFKYLWLSIQWCQGFRYVRRTRMRSSRLAAVCAYALRYPVYPSMMNAIAFLSWRSPYSTSRGKILNGYPRFIISLPDFATSFFYVSLKFSLSPIISTSSHWKATFDNLIVYKVILLLLISLDSLADRHLTL